uniref:Uncharacterized protein n=1 Tax=Plectus sambesii TaxID=2011161 RepID=A0A914WU37_9BILA
MEARGSPQHTSARPIKRLPSLIPSTFHHHQQIWLQAANHRHSKATLFFESSETLGHPVPPAPSYAPATFHDEHIRTHARRDAIHFVSKPSATITVFNNISTKLSDDSRTAAWRSGSRATKKREYLYPSKACQA